MKRIVLAIPLLAIAGSLAAQTPVKKSAPKTQTTAVKKTVSKVSPSKKFVAAPHLVMKNKLDSASYAFGNAMARNLKEGGLSGLNYALLNKGMQDAFAGAKGQMDEQTSQKAINTIFEVYAKVREEQKKAEFADVIKAGENFLAQNKQKPGIITTASGLQYEVITAGTGTKPKATDKVTVHYKGTLLDGKEFDSSYKSNNPVTFGLTQVIRGWTEGVQLMNEGSKYRFFIPYQLAYGARGAGADIKPFSTLIFEVELLKVNGEQ
jgi:FKBP-type peptidyl-prolyl cis-trans isomerase